MNIVYNTNGFSEKPTTPVTFSHFLMTGLGPAQARRKNPSSSLTYGEADQEMTFIEITFNGYTRTYAELSACQFAQLDDTQLWYLDAGSRSRDYLSIGLLGDGVGSYSFDTGSTDPVSIVTYGTGQKIYSSYYVDSRATRTLAMPNGRVDVDRIDRSRLVRLTFSGTLMPLNGSDCANRPMPVAGRLCLAC